MLPLTELLRRDDDAVAVIDADTGRVLTHAALQSAVAARAGTWSGLSGRLAFLGVGRGLVSVIDLLALIRSGATTALLDRSAPPDRLARWVAAYEPEAVLGFDAAPDTPVPADGRPPLPEAVLMATSGSTGSPKFVRLSAAGVVANAEQIVTATRIGEHDRALAHLPLSSVYGLSVVTSHLVAGACIVLSATSATRPQFAAVLAEHAVTSLPGVPFSLEMYRRTGLLSRDLPALRDLTAAGGRVPDDLLAATIDACHVSGRRFWPMYGQTEACGRISVLPADELPDMAGSVGYPVPGTRVWIADADADGRGTVHVSGPGNMLGYATGRADVGAGSDPVADLDTGDLGRLDAAGRLWITGRSQRIVGVAEAVLVVGVRHGCDGRIQGRELDRVDGLGPALRAGGQFGLEPDRRVVGRVLEDPDRDEDEDDGEGAREGGEQLPADACADDPWGRGPLGGGCLRFSGHQCVPDPVVVASRSAMSLP